MSVVSLFSEIEIFGARVTVSVLPVERWLSESKYLIDSRKSPSNSTLQGCFSLNDQKSIIEPRIEKSPGFPTNLSRA